MYPSLQEQKKAYVGTRDEDRNIRGIRIKARLSLHLGNVRGYL